MISCMTNKLFIQHALLDWYDTNARDLPWRRTNDPYAIWLSEIMLQQTQVVTVIPYYEKFLAKFSTVQKLARAKLDTVLKLWEGLGYYSRARNLHNAANIVSHELDGKFPQTVEGLMTLPGIGRYTAGAIASIAFNVKASVLDGNVIRVLCRLHQIADDPKATTANRRLWELADSLVPSRRPGDFNQALMELGATICTPANPDCSNCPLNKKCLAYQNDMQEQLPTRKQKPKLPHYTIVVGIVFRQDGKILIDKRKANAMLGGLWEFPGGKKKSNETFKQAVAREVREETGIEIEVQKRLMIVKHTYSHFRITLHAYLCDYICGTAKPMACDAVKWVTNEQLNQHAFPTANVKIIDTL